MSGGAWGGALFLVAERGGGGSCLAQCLLSRSALLLSACSGCTSATPPCPFSIQNQSQTHPNSKFKHNQNSGVTAGYGDEVIFADGTFVDGSTAELSADGPLRPPYVVYCQGGTHYTHWALALESAVAELRAQLAAEAAAAN